MSEPLSTKPLRIADAMRGVRHVFVRDLEVETEIGVHPREKFAPQRIVVNVDLAVCETPVKDTDRYSDVVCYEQVVERVRAFAEEGHVNLVETMAERIAAACLEDSRVLSARVRIEKPDIFEDCRSVGIEIERFQPIP
jgi:dihydroneopterin aldolase